MVLKVVGIVSSPRKEMNTDTLVTKALEGAQSIGAETEKIYLNDLEIKPCQACDRFPAPDYCFYRDGMEKIYDVLATADALVIGAPAYFGSFSAQLKLLIDRSNCLAEMVTLPDGKLIFKSRLEKRKKGIFIWVANLSKNPEHALVSIRIWCKYFANVELVDTLVITDSDRGEGARKREELLHKAFKLGVSLGRG
jgi:multimeric flavodoxin WrbA